MAFPTPPDPHDMLGDIGRLGPLPTVEELERQRAWREALEEFARQLKAWWWENQQQPIPRAEVTLLVREQKVTLSKATLSWFEAAQKEGVKDAGDRMAKYILSDEFLKKLLKD